MLLTTIMDRVFIHKENNQEIQLQDPGKEMSPESVLNFYSANYPILTNARITGPEIKKDRIEFRFESTMGTKG